jgi:prevent-host-death family protein
MRAPRYSEDVIGISELRSNAARVAEHVAESGAPVIVTQHGRAAMIVLSPAAFDELTIHKQVITAINDGLADIEAGRVIKHDDLMKEMKALSAAAKKQPAAKRKKTA